MHGMHHCGKAGIKGAAAFWKRKNQDSNSSSEGKIVRVCM